MTASDVPRVIGALVDGGLLRAEERETAEALAYAEIRTLLVKDLDELEERRDTLLPTCAPTLPPSDADG